MCGRTGSGKSTLANWFLKRSPGSWVILNPKHTAAYKELPDAVTIETLSFKKIDDVISSGKYRFVIVNPESTQADPDTMDAFIMHLHRSWRDVGLCCDELYTLHKGNGMAGQGLLGWLTRGRELGQSFLGLTQRPSFLSQFLYSESDYIGTMSLSLRKDRKRLEELTDQPQMGRRVPDYYWLWYETRGEKLRLFEPIPFDN